MSDSLPNIAEFDAYFAGKSRWFSAAEIRYLGASNAIGGRAAGLNHLPPRDQWDNILPTLAMADKIRALYGDPVRILSGFRSEAYNKKIGGASQSYHKRFMALDLAPVSGRPGAVTRLYGCALLARKKGKFEMGLGRYTWGIHIDCGPSREW